MQLLQGEAGGAGDQAQRVDQHLSTAGNFHCHILEHLSQKVPSHLILRKATQVHQGSASEECGADEEWGSATCGTDVNRGGVSESAVNVHLRGCQESRWVLIKLCRIYTKVIIIKTLFIHLYK